MTKRLAERDRAFFSLVARAAFANPFGHERAALDAEIGDTSPDDPRVLARVSARLESRLASLGAGPTAALAAVAEQDRDQLFAAIAFSVFHRYMDEIDRLIALGGKVGFARRLLADLVGFGVMGAQAERALALFVQMRRAHLAIGTRLIGSGPSMRRLREELWNAVFTHDILRYERTLWRRMEDFSTLLIGETGTGKGEAARAIGRSGFIPYDAQRGEFASPVDELFVPINLAEYPASLIESELFGHKRGAFTGAIDHHEGALARVKPHGTLFLDEIGEVDPAIQVKLLRVLQERVFTPVGAHEVRRFHGRVVAATHRAMTALRAERRMRDDFYYRLSTHTIEVPSLRTRLSESPGELALLTAHICERVVGEPAPDLADYVRERIERALGPHYPYPGNVRELEQCVRRVLLTGRCTRDEARADEPSLARQIDHGTLDAEALVRGYCALLYDRTKSYVQVAKITGLDRRTVRRHLTAKEA